MPEEQHFPQKQYAQPRQALRHNHRVIDSGTKKTKLMGSILRMGNLSHIYGSAVHG